MAVKRFYELHKIVWHDRGSEWTGYPTREAAQATVDYAHANDPDSGRGEVVTTEFSVIVKPEFAAIYKPGIRDEEV